MLLAGVACDHDGDIFSTSSDSDSSDSDSSHPTSPATVRLVPDASHYGVGADVTTSLVIENATKVGSVALRLRYDPAVIEYVDSEEGSFMNSDGSVTLFLAGPTAGGGEIAVGLSRLGGGPGASGSGLLATFRFHSVGPGDGGFAFTANANIV